MSTVLISTSPKQAWSNSAYLLSVARLAAGGRGRTEWLEYRGAKNCGRVLDALEGADAVVLGMPLYVDAVPSHALHLMREIERRFAGRKTGLKVYAICNCGFYEGVQCELEMEMLRCWCERCGFTFCGGAGIGAGEMIGVLRLSPLFGLIAMLIEWIIRFSISAASGDASPAAALSSVHFIGFFVAIAVGVVFSIGPWLAAAKVGRAAAAGKEAPVRYSTVSFCPAPLFVFFASIYWALRAFFMHLVPLWKLFRRV